MQQSLIMLKNLVKKKQNNTDVSLIFNGNKIYSVTNQLDIFDVENKKSNFIFGYCFWVSQPSLLVSSNKLIGLTYLLDKEYRDLVLKWVLNTNNPHLNIKSSKHTEYYGEKVGGMNCFLKCTGS